MYVPPYNHIGDLASARGGDHTPAREAQESATRAGIVSSPAAKHRAQRVQLAGYRRHSHD